MLELKSNEIKSIYGKGFFFPLTVYVFPLTHLTVTGLCIYPCFYLKPPQSGTSTPPDGLLCGASCCWWRKAAASYNPTNCDENREELISLNRLFSLLLPFF